MTEKRYRTWRLLQIYSILTSANQAPSKEMEKKGINDRKKNFEARFQENFRMWEKNGLVSQKGDESLPTMTNALGWPTVNFKTVDSEFLIENSIH